MHGLYQGLSQYRQNRVRRWQRQYVKHLDWLRCSRLCPTVLMLILRVHLFKANLGLELLKPIQGPLRLLKEDHQEYSQAHKNHNIGEHLNFCLKTSNKRSPSQHSVVRCFRKPWKISTRIWSFVVSSCLLYLSRPFDKKTKKLRA